MRGKLAAFLCIIFLLCGCGKENEPLNKALSLRNRLLEGNGCSFTATVQADYGEKLYTFKMDCRTDQAGNLTFSVTQPATIYGITGKVSTAGGAITFDDKILAFPTIADDQVSPVSAPWLMIKTLRSGYLKGCATLDYGYEISIDDSYEDGALHFIIDAKDETPISAEIFWEGRRVLTLSIEEFTYL